ncbi:MAG: hypothetical protein AB2693_22070, partial [Candidatus Thiodiazotropha sp.]
MQFNENGIFQRNLEAKENSYFRISFPIFMTNFVYEVMNCRTFHLLHYDTKLMKFPQKMSILYEENRIFYCHKCVVKSSVSAHVCDVMGENWTMFPLKEMHI